MLTLNFVPTYHTRSHAGREREQDERLMTDTSFTTNNNPHHNIPPPPSSSEPSRHTTTSTHDKTEIAALNKQHRLTQDNLALAQNKIEQMTGEIASLEKALMLAKSVGNAATGDHPDSVYCMSPVAVYYMPLYLVY